MQFYIKHASYYCEDKYERIQGVIDYVNILLSGLYEPHEIPERALEVYFMDYYLQQVKNGGHRQFFMNCSFSRNNQIALQMIIQGLKRLESTAHQQIFHSALELINSESPEPEKIVDGLNIIDDLFFKLTDQFENLNYLNVEKIDQLTIVSEEEFEGCMQNLLNLLPDYEVRAEAEALWEAENEPEFSKIVKQLCEKFALELISINALDYGDGIVSDEEAEKNAEHDHWYCHITTASGYHYVINSGDAMTLVDGENNKIIGTLNGV